MLFHGISKILVNIFFLIFFLITKANLFIDNRLFSSFLFMLSHVLYIYIFLLSTVYGKTRRSVSGGIYKLSIDSAVYRVDSSRYKTVRGEGFFRLHSFRFLPSFSYHRAATSGTRMHARTHAFHRRETNPTRRSNRTRYSTNLIVIE